MEIFLVIGVIVILAAAALIGYARGFIHIVLSLVTFLVATVIATLLTGPICRIVYTSSVYEEVTDNIEQFVGEQLELETANVTEIVNNNLLDNLGLPSAITDKLNDALLANEGELASVQDISKCVAEKFAAIIVNAAVYLIIFALAVIALQIIIFLADIVSKLPGLNALNRCLGLVCGLVNGVIILWICCVVITIISGTETGAALMKTIYQNQFLNFIYSHNPLLELLTTKIL